MSSDEDPDEQLKFAISKCNLRLIQQSLINGANVNLEAYWESSKNGKWETPLIRTVAQTGNFNIVQYLISQEANLYAVDENRNMAIQYKQNSNKPAIVLLEQKMRETINHLDEKGNTPLTFCVQYGNIEGVKMLIDMGANVCLAGRNGDSPLVRAVKKQKFEIIKYLLEHGAKPTATSGLYCAILYWQESHIEYLKILFQLGDIDIDVVLKHGQTPLLLALRRRKTKFAIYFMQQGADVDLADPQGNAPLTVSLKHGLFDVARKLVVEVGCNLNSYGPSPIKICLDNSWLGLAMTLKEKGATVDDEETFYVDLLLSGNVTVAKRIISMGIVNVNQEHDEGKTVLTKCLDKSNALLFKMLVEEAGGDINYKNSDGKSLLSLAASKGDLTIVLYLIEKGANVQNANEDLEDFASWNDSFACFFSKHKSNAVTPVTIEGSGQEDGEDPSSVN